jgi:hypothetical protein
MCASMAAPDVGEVVGDDGFGLARLAMEGAPPAGAVRSGPQHTYNSRL